MIRIAIGKTALEDDSPDDSAAAYGAGWRIDEDDWWVRPLKDADPFVHRHEGFGFVAQRHVFVASAAAAMAFDVTLT